MIERRRNETAPAYGALIEYAAMGPARSLSKLALKLHKSKVLLGGWSRRHHWQERIRGYDTDQASKTEAAKHRARETVELNETMRREEVQKSAWEWFETLRAKAMDMLAFPVGDREVKETYPDGREKITIVRPVKWTFGDLARMVQLADQLARLSTGMATGRHELTGPGGEPLPTPKQETGSIVINVTRGAETERAVAQFGERPDGQ